MASPLDKLDYFTTGVFSGPLSAAWFTIMDHDGMKAHQYMAHGDHSMLNTTDMVDLNQFEHHFTDASLVRVQLVDGIPQVVVRYGEDEYEYLHGLTGLPWQTGRSDGNTPCTSKLFRSR